MDLSLCEDDADPETSDGLNGLDQSGYRYVSCQLKKNEIRIINKGLKHDEQNHGNLLRRSFMDQQFRVPDLEGSQF